MKRFIFIPTVVILMGAARSSATIIHVPDDYSTIQEGIEASSDWDTVLVADGHYYERINFRGKDIVVASQFIMDGDTVHIHNTIIDADTLILGIADTGSVVCFVNEEYATSVIRGFTIKNGIGTLYLYDYRYGGGIFCCYASPTIENNIIVDNGADYLGGGISCNYSNAIVRNNVIVNNSTDGYYAGGGGICCIEANVTIEENVISENHCQGGGGASLGGGIFCDYCSPIILNNTISGNTAGGDVVLGGGIKLAHNSSFISGNIIAGNEVSSSDNVSAVGGGISCDLSSSPTIINNVVTRNSADGGGGIYCPDNNFPTLINNIFWADTASVVGNEFYGGGFQSVTYCNIQGGWEGEGNIDVDPRFRDPENGDFHLMSSACGYQFDSPCIDAGDPSIIDNFLHCDWGLRAVRSDMGAFGGQEIPTEINDDDDVIIPSHFSLLQNHPNPFNAVTTIQLVIPETGDIRLSIYNLLGQRVAILFEGIQQAGGHSVIWDASGFPSGVYFARLEAREQSENVKMVLLK